MLFQERAPLEEPIYFEYNGQKWVYDYTVLNNLQKVGAETTGQYYADMAAADRPTIKQFLDSEAYMVPLMITALLINPVEADGKFGSYDRQTLEKAISFISRCKDDKNIEVIINDFFLRKGSTMTYSSLLQTGKTASDPISQALGFLKTLKAAGSMMNSAEKQKDKPVYPESGIRKNSAKGSVKASKTSGS